MAEECWRDVKGYEGLYQVSNHGNVRSLKREVPQGKYGKTRLAGGSLMKPTNNGNGYLLVGLRRLGKRKNFYVHRLVAEHFIANDHGYKYVNHKDYDTSNNRADNLEWCTQKENTRYSAHKMRKPHKSWKQTATNEKHIYIRNGRFRLMVKGIIDRTYPTLEEAVKARGVVLSGEKYLAG